MKPPAVDDLVEVQREPRGRWWPARVTSIADGRSIDAWADEPRWHGVGLVPEAEGDQRRWRWPGRRQ